MLIFNIYIKLIIDFYFELSLINHILITDSDIPT